MIVVAVLIVVIVVILGITAIFSKNTKTPEPVVDTRTDEERLADQMTATKHYSLSDPEFVVLKEKMSAPKLVLPSAAERARLVGSMSVEEI